ncbi:MAG: transposase, partial [Bacteroidales bacterium]|nr:transposase [Bacteroidales bacterium]
MNQKKQTSESKIKEIRRHTHKKYSAEEKIRIVFEGLRGEVSIAELYRKEGINANLYYNWSKDFMEAGWDIPSQNLQTTGTIPRRILLNGPRMAG